MKFLVNARDRGVLKLFNGKPLSLSRSVSLTNQAEAVEKKQLIKDFKDIPSPPGMIFAL